MQLKDVAEIHSSKAESHVNGNNITTFTKTKNEDREKEIFVSEEYFLTLLQVHYVTLVWFCFCSTNFLSSFILNYWCDLPSESKQGSKKISQLPFLDKLTYSSKGTQKNGRTVI